MRNIMLPVLVAGAIGLPILISNSNPEKPQGQVTNPHLQTFDYSNAPSQNQMAPSHVASYSANQNAQPMQTGQVSNQTVPPGMNRSLGNGQGRFILAAHPNRVVLPGNAAGPDLSAPPMEFLPTSNLAEIISFELTPQHIKQRWPRVSTAPSDVGLQGMRVALVTGTNPNDLHGSMTYHFDKRHKLQRISFQGWTGDPSRLVNLLTDRFSFQKKPTRYSGLYVATSAWKKTGVLLMRDPDVIRSETPNQQVALVLEMNNPSGGLPLSQSIQSILIPAR